MRRALHNINFRKDKHIKSLRSFIFIVENFAVECMNGHLKLSADDLFRSLMNFEMRFFFTWIRYVNRKSSLRNLPMIF